MQSESHVGLGSHGTILVSYFSSLPLRVTAITPVPPTGPCSERYRTVWRLRQSLFPFTTPPYDRTSTPRGGRASYPPLLMTAWRPSLPAVGPWGDSREIRPTPLTLRLEALAALLPPVLLLLLLLLPWPRPPPRSLLPALPLPPSPSRLSASSIPDAPPPSHPTRLAVPSSSASPASASARSCTSASPRQPGSW